MTDNDKLAEKMMLYRSHGMDRNKVIYWHELPGHNFRLTNFQAAFGVAQLEQKDKIIKERKRIYDAYYKAFSQVQGIALQKVNNNIDPVIWAIALKLDQKAFPQGRNTVMNQMKESGIETRPGFYASSFLHIYEKHRLPVCEDISKNVISVPSFPTLTFKEIEYVSTQLLKLKK